jgi:hypothetical protein
MDILWFWKPSNHILNQRFFDPGNSQKHISRGYKQPQRTTQQLLFHCWWWWWWWWPNWFQCPTLHCQNLKLISGQGCSARDSIIRPNLIASIPTVQVERVAYILNFMQVQFAQQRNKPWVTKCKWSNDRLCTCKISRFLWSCICTKKTTILHLIACCNMLLIMCSFYWNDWLSKEIESSRLNFNIVSGFPHCSEYSVHIYARIDHAHAIPTL